MKLTRTPTEISPRIAAAPPSHSTHPMPAAEIVVCTGRKTAHAFRCPMKCRQYSRPISS